MPRIRTLKPELWLSAQVMNLTHSARLLFIGLITQADDEGRGSSDTRKLKAAIFGGDDVTLADIRTWLTEIEDQRLAITYTSDGYGDLYWLPSWKEHQYVQKAQPSRYPPPVDNSLPERYRNATGTVPERYRGIGRIGSEGKDRKGLPERGAAPDGAPRPIADSAEAWVKGVA